MNQRSCSPKLLPAVDRGRIGDVISTTMAEGVHKPWATDDDPIKVLIELTLRFCVHPQILWADTK